MKETIEKTIEELEVIIEEVTEEIREGKGPSMGIFCGTRYGRTFSFIG